MIREGDMVRAGGSPIMRVALVFRGMAALQHIDQHGRLRLTYRYLSELSPWWSSAGARSLWPETTDAIPEDYVVKAKPPKRKKSKKPKASRKISRKPPALNTARFDILFGTAA